MKRYNVTGMSCAACSARVEKAVLSVEGVKSCSVSLLTNSLAVEGDAEPLRIIDAVHKAGYGASEIEEGRQNNDEDNSETKKEISRVKTRFLVSAIFLIPLMYISMGHNMLAFPLPSIIEARPAINALIQLILCLCVMIINKKFFINGFLGALRLSPNMDTLVSLGSLASFAYSAYLFGVMLTYPDNAHAYLHELYFESAAMILVLITLGKFLEARSKGKTTDALRSLIKLSPKTVSVIRDGLESVISIDELEVGEVFIVRPGEKIAADGVVIEGNSAVDESALSGESVPADKICGDKVSAATVNLYGVLKCRAERVGEDTTLSQIIKTVSEASATKAPIAKIADKVSGVFVPIVMAISLLTLSVWLLLNEGIGFAMARAISVLVISCPCALGLATPVSIMVAGGVGAKNGILFKNAEVLERAGKVKIVALDKTGTLTNGEPVVTDLIEVSVTRDKLLEMAYAVEINSEHPLAKAVVKYAIDNAVNRLKVSDFCADVGSGVSATVDNVRVYGGSLTYAESHMEIDAKTISNIQALADQGKTPLLFFSERELYGAIAVADTIKEDSAQAVSSLKKMGIEVAMITGDNSRTAKAIAATAGIDTVISDVLPNEKAQRVRELSERGSVAMVGDGINDAPALTVADVGIAIGAGTDVAIDAAQIVLVNSRLTDAVAAIRLSKATLRTIHQNLFWAFIYNIIGIPLAAGIFIYLLGWYINPMFGAAAMSLSSICVVSNALRLNSFKVHRNSIKTVENISKEREDVTMKKTMKIEGMMCGHCEARVKKTLEALPQVDEAIVSHVEGTAVLTLNAQISDEELKKIIEDQDYKVISIN